MPRSCASVRACGVICVLCCAQVAVLRRDSHTFSQNLLIIMMILSAGADAPEWLQIIKKVFVDPVERGHSNRLDAHAMLDH